MITVLAFYSRAVILPKYGIVCSWHYFLRFYCTETTAQNFDPKLRITVQSLLYMLYSRIHIFWMTKKAIPRIECIRQVDLFRIGIASGKWCIVHMLQAENVYTLGIQNRIRKGGSVLIGWNRGKYSSDMKERERECWTALCGFSLLFFMPNIKPQDHITAIWRNFFCQFTYCFW